MKNKYAILGCLLGIMICSCNNSAIEQENKQLREALTELKNRSNSNNSFFQQGSWIDLSYDFAEDTIYWPTAQEFKAETVFHGTTDKGYFYSAKNFSGAEHGGTHVDSPIHFAKGRETVDKIPISRLLGPAAVVDVSAKALKNRDYQVTVEDLTNWEQKHGKIKDQMIVLLRTGSGRFWPDRAKYMGTNERGKSAVAKLHFPGLAPEAAKWIVANRKISAIGIDTPSIDYGQSKLFKSHRILFAEGIPAFENVAYLDKLPEKGAFVIALPIKIRGGSGGPTRIVAWLPK